MSHSDEYSYHSCYTDLDFHSGSTQSTSSSDKSELVSSYHSLSDFVSMDRHSPSLFDPLQGGLYSNPTLSGSIGTPLSRPYEGLDPPFLSSMSTIQTGSVLQDIQPQLFPNTTHTATSVSPFQTMPDISPNPLNTATPGSHSILGFTEDDVYFPPRTMSAPAYQVSPNQASMSLGSELNPMFQCVSTRQLPSRVNYHSIGVQAGAPSTVFVKPRFELPQIRRIQVSEPPPKLENPTSITWQEADWFWDKTPIPDVDGSADIIHKLWHLLAIQSPVMVLLSPGSLSDVCEGIFSTAHDSVEIDYEVAAPTPNRVRQRLLCMTPEGTVPNFIPLDAVVRAEVWPDQFQESGDPDLQNLCYPMLTREDRRKQRYSQSVEAIFSSVVTHLRWGPLSRDQLSAATGFERRRLSSALSPIVAVGLLLELPPNVSGPKRALTMQNAHAAVINGGVRLPPAEGEFYAKMASYNDMQLAQNAFGGPNFPQQTGFGMAVDQETGIADEHEVLPQRSRGRGRGRGRGAGRGRGRGGSSATHSTGTRGRGRGSRLTGDRGTTARGAHQLPHMRLARAVRTEAITFNISDWIRFAVFCDAFWSFSILMAHEIAAFLFPHSFPHFRSGACLAEPAVSVYGFDQFTALQARLLNTDLHSAVQELIESTEQGLLPRQMFVEMASPIAGAARPQGGEATSLYLYHYPHIDLFLQIAGTSVMAWDPLKQRGLPITTDQARQDDVQTEAPRTGDVALSLNSSECSAGTLTLPAHPRIGASVTARKPRGPRKRGHHTPISDNSSEDMSFVLSLEGSLPPRRSRISAQEDIDNYAGQFSDDFSDNSD